MNTYTSHPLYNAVNDQRIQSLLPNFNGLCWRLAMDWLTVVPQTIMNFPFHYLEIGTLHGANLVSVWKTYGNGAGENPNAANATYTIIDPYFDYDEYHEYKGEQTTNFQTFQQNLRLSKMPASQITFYRDVSSKVVPTLPDEKYHLIYIDGNHLPQSVLEDAVLCWRKLAPMGILIFDDYGWGGPDVTQRGIDAFVAGYRDEFHKHYANNGQYFIQKSPTQNTI